MTQTILSANYMDRGNKDRRWLLRAPHETEESAHAVSAVLARSVSFRDSGSLEQGYGCSMVAVTEEPIVFSDHYDMDGARRIRFDDGVFIIEDSGARVYTVRNLLLKSDGSMYMLPTVNPLLTADELILPQPVSPELMKTVEVLNEDDKVVAQFTTPLSTNVYGLRLKAVFPFGFGDKVMARSSGTDTPFEAILISKEPDGDGEVRIAFLDSDGDPDDKYVPAGYITAR